MSDDVFRRVWTFWVSVYCLFAAGIIAGWLWQIAGLLSLLVPAGLALVTWFIIRFGAPLPEKVSERCSAATSCRDPNEPNPCYSSHQCDLEAGHSGAHQTSDHPGMSWTGPGRVFG